MYICSIYNIVVNEYIVYLQQILANLDVVAKKEDSKP